MSSKEECLDIRKQTKRHLLLEEWMSYLVLLPLLPETYEALTSRLLEEDSLFSLRNEVTSLHLSFVDDRQDKAIDQVGSHFLHEVERKPSSTRTVDM